MPPSPRNAMPRIAPPTRSQNASRRSLPSICVLPRKPSRRAMEVKSSAADRFVTRPPKGLVAALVYGPDQGLVRERATNLAKSVVPDLNDPFRVAELAVVALQ